MNIINNPKIIFIFLLVIVCLSGVLRIYKLDSVPPSISWDEASVGYNAWSIASYGRDETGKLFPPYFSSFLDDKHPVHIYITALFVKFMGLNEFSTRLPAALFGVFNVILIFFLGKELFKNKFVGIIGATVLAISPYNLQFSRFNHELNFTIFFFMLGLLFFIKGVKSKNFLLPISFLSFGICLISYHSAKVVVPPMILLLIVLYCKELLKIKKLFLTGLIFLSFFIFLIAYNPPLLGLARLDQAGISHDLVIKTDVYQKTHNELQGWLSIVWTNYQSHFSESYLFLTGDSNVRHSSQGVGTFYPIEAVFLVIGFLALLWKRSRISILLLSWAFLAPIPASVTQEAPHAARAMFMTGSWHLIIGLGIYSTLKILKFKYLQIAAVIFLIIIYGIFLKNYLNYYYGDYVKKSAIEWQYGMKQIVEYIAKNNNDYIQVYMTSARSQPYIFFLYYLRPPLSDFMDTVSYNESESRSYNLVSFFDKYYFGGWDTVEIMPNKGVLYVLTPSEYDGLRHKTIFDIKKQVKYPNGIDAFFLVSYP